MAGRLRRTAPGRQRFRASIRKQGVNPYVEVPEAVSRALGAYARGGRIRFEGTLDRQPIRGTLVPRAGGRHRIFVNAGMRALAGVSVGDTATFELRATLPGKVILPRDIARGLAAVEGAREAFAAGKPPFVRDLFDRFRAMVEACGPVKMLHYRVKVGFMVRVRFTGAVPKTRWLEIGFWLPRRIESPRFHKIETIYPHAHVHRLRVTKATDLDREVAGWLREAYAIGCQGHLQRR